MCSWIMLFVWWCHASILLWLSISPVGAAALDAFLLELPQYDHGVDLPTKYPLVIAHRGSSGRLPEHTVEAYSAAVLDGADIIECDVTVTRDLHLICSHEPWLSSTTDISSVYPTRKNTYYIPDLGKNITDYFAIDFTMEELRKIYRKQRYDFRDRRYDGKYGIATLADYIKVAQSTPRPVGIYPELKQPRFTNSHPVLQQANTTFEELLVNQLKIYGYNRKTDPCFLQSFDESSLRRLVPLTDLPKVILLKGNPDLSNERLKALAEFCYAIGPYKEFLVKTEDKVIVEVTDLVPRAHQVGLRVHAYTFRNEDRYLAWDYGQDALMEYDRFQGLLLDGFFTDFPYTLSRHLNMTYRLEEGDCWSNASALTSASTQLLALLIVTYLFNFKGLYYI